MLTRIRTNAPHLEQRLDESPAAVVYGYQILPKLLPDPQRPESSPPIAAVGYSWPRTDAALAAAMRRLEEAQQKLPRLEEAVASYRLLLSEQKTIDQFLQHNRFWQKAIHEDKDRFLAETRAIDAILAQLKISGELQPKPRVSSFVRIAERVRVPLYSDITDESFLKSAEEAIESMWRYSDGVSRYEVDVEIRQLSPEQLYGAEKPPAAGSHLDVAAHAARFPSDGGVLTTGSNATFAMAGRYIAFGPAGISRTALAHEFGHILGFSDAYMRGFRDLGQDGYEILELVPDPDDIMAVPGIGRVQQPHFAALVESR